MRDLTEVLDLDLHLPVRGKDYVVHPPSAAVAAGLMNRLAAGVAIDAGIPLDADEAALAIVDDEDMPDFGLACLGPVLAEATADGLSQPELDFMVETAFLAWTIGKEYAESHWESGGKAHAPRPTGRPTETPTRTAAASTTQSSASASGTSSPKGKHRGKGAQASL